jgi:DNA repair exonuclease SbcCD ATPase subunit
MPQRRPYSRGEYNRALIANALLDPFNVVLLAVILIVGILLGILVPLLPVAGLVYLAAAARTYFDDDAANKVLERERSKQRKGVERGRRRVLPHELAPPIARLAEAAREREAKIRAAIERAELPYDEVAAEVDGFVVATEGTARRAQLLYEALEDTPPARVAARLEQVRSDPDRAQLAEALTTQLETLRRMERQLDRFYGELERIIVELDTVRSQLVSMSASTETAQQDRLAGEVRELRERMGAVAEGMAAAYEPPPA